LNIWFLFFSDNDKNSKNIIIYIKNKNQLLNIQYATRPKTRPTAVFSIQRLPPFKLTNGSKCADDPTRKEKIGPNLITDT